MVYPVQRIAIRPPGNHRAGEGRAAEKRERRSLANPIPVWVIPRRTLAVEPLVRSVCKSRNNRSCRVEPNSVPFHTH